MAESNICDECFQNHPPLRCMDDRRQDEVYFEFADDDDRRIYGIFQKVFRVLSAELENVPENSNQHLGSAAVQLHNVYGREGSGRSADFSEVNERAAYLMLYSSCASSLLYTCLKRAFIENEEGVRAWADRLKTTGKLNVVSLGGGPGTDLFGLMAFFNQYFEELKNMSLEYTSLDSAAEWEDARRVTENICRENMASQWENVSLSLKRCNLLDTFDDDVYKKIEGADIVVLLLIVSELFPSGKRSNERNREIIDMINETRRRMKTGALMVYVDASKDMFQSKFYHGLRGEENARSHKLMFPVYRHARCIFYRNLREKSEDWQDLINNFSMRFPIPGSFGTNQPLGTMSVSLAITEKQDD